MKKTLIIMASVISFLIFAGCQDAKKSNDQVAPDSRGENIENVTQTQQCPVGCDTCQKDGTTCKQCTQCNKNHGQCPNNGQCPNLDQCPNGGQCPNQGQDQCGGENGKKPGQGQGNGQCGQGKGGGQCRK